MTLASVKLTQNWPAQFTELNTAKLLYNILNPFIGLLSLLKSTVTALSRFTKYLSILENINS